MTEPRRRPILHLKLGTVVRPLGPAALEPVAPPAPKPYAPKPYAPKPYGAKRPMAKAPPAPAPAWKCRPCGTAFTPAATAADEEAVRCPSCNAKLGLAGDFRKDPPNLDRLRARPARR